MTDVSSGAGWRQTIHQSEPWTIQPSYSSLVGFHISQIVPDLLHVWNLGVARDMLASSLQIIMKERTIFNAPNVRERLALASTSLKMFAKTRKLPLRMRKLTRAKLGWKAKKYPMLGSSGYDAYVVGLWLEHILCGFGDTYPEISTLLWSSNRALSLLYHAGRFLSSQEKASVETLGDIFLRTYLSMANWACENHKLLFRVRPKLHMLCHVFQSTRICNQSFYSTWQDEDFLKKCGKTLGLTDVRGSDHRLLERWLLSIPQNLQKTLGK